MFLGLLLGGTGFYSSAEGWSLVDSLYLSVMTLSTVGYGDLAPTTGFSKMFTVLYVLAGAGVFVAFITKEPGLDLGILGRGRRRRGDTIWRRME